MHTRGSSSPKSAPRQNRSRPFSRAVLEALESRVLLSAAVGSNVQLLAYVPNEVSIASPKYSNLWHLNNTGQTLTSALTGPATGTSGADISAQKAWDLTTGSSNVVIAVFDTGVDLTHPDLTANLWTNTAEIPSNGIDDDHNGFTDDVNGWNFVDGNNNVADTVGHGTTVTGVIGASGNNAKGVVGVDWNVSLLTVKVGTASGVASQDLVNGINYVIALKKAGVNIVAINASYISTGTLGLTELSAIASAGSNNILYVAAAGNGGINYDTFGFGAFLPSNMLLVGATDNRDNLSTFSNYGPNSVAIAAPGTDITTTFLSGTYVTVSGTSYSAPMVAGVAALLKSQVPSATMTQIKNAILSGADIDPALAGKIGGSRRLNAYKALQSLLGAVAPTGYLDVANSSTISGWAFDANAGRNAAYVQILIDGTPYTTLSANVDRPDLSAPLGSTAHGFTLSTPSLSSGNHTLAVYALDNAGGASTLLGSKTINVIHPPIGYFDDASNNTLTGWAYDQDSPSQSINIRVDIDGITATTLPTNNSRPDVNSAFSLTGTHGFSIPVPATSPGIHRIDIYALDSTTSSPTLLGSRTVNTNRDPIGYLDGATTGRIAGWAWDQDTNSQAVRIRLDIDSFAPVYILANVSRPDVNAYTGGAHAFDVALPQLPTGAHSIKAYALDTTSSLAKLIGSTTLTISSPAGNPLPYGYFDGASTANAYGWAYDPSTSASVNVRIDIDGTPGTPFLASQSRPDLTAAIGSPNHGFTYSLPSLTPGVHYLDLYVLDSTTSTPVWINRRLVASTTSLYGSVDTLTTTSLSGWAFNPSLGTNAAKARVDIDDFLGPTLLAADTRNDLTPVVGSPNHGFQLTLPKVSPGQHRVRVWVLDDYLGTKLLADQTLTFP